MCELIFLDARNRRVLMLGKAIINMGLRGHEQVRGEGRKAGVK